MNLNPHDDPSRKPEVIRCVRMLDVPGARAAMGAPVELDDEVILTALHKIRYEAADLVEDVLRYESYRWLKQHGHDRWGMRPLLPDGELPEGTGA